MAKLYDTMMSPEVEGLMEKVGSKFGLCTLASTRAREINAYFGQLGEGLGAKVPPQVTSVARKPLSIAFEEIAAEKIVPRRLEDVEAEIDLVAEGEGDAAASDDSA
jgi:DNA-directed RNA polymerase subunit omega